MQFNPLLATMITMAMTQPIGYDEKPEVVEVIEGSEPIEIGEDVWKPSRKRSRHELEMLAQIARFEVSCLKAFPDAQIASRSASASDRPADQRVRSFP